MSNNKNRKKNQKTNKSNKTSKFFYYLAIIIALFFSITFIFSPLLLKCECIANIYDIFFDSLRYSGYKEAYIGGICGLIGAGMGAGIAIPGALWVERKKEKDLEENKIEKIALILYFDIKLFYKELKPLATILSPILAQQKCEQSRILSKYKNTVGVHIHQDWIGLTATLKDKFNEEELEDIYLFYGIVTGIKTMLENETIESHNIQQLYDHLKSIGDVSNEYNPNKKYTDIIKRLKDIAKYYPENQQK